MLLDCEPSDLQDVRSGHRLKACDDGEILQRPCISTNSHLHNTRLPWQLKLRAKMMTSTSIMIAEEPLSIQLLHGFSCEASHFTVKGSVLQVQAGFPLVVKEISQCGEGRLQKSVSLSKFVLDRSCNLTSGVF